MKRLLDDAWIILLLIASTTIFAATHKSAHKAQNDNRAAATNLGTIKVEGERKKVLMAIKIALKTPLSTDPAKANQVVCRLGTRRGSHLKQIVCATNKTRFQRQDAAQLGILKAASGAGGLSLQNLVNSLEGNSSSQGFLIIGNPSKLEREMNTLPPVPKNSAVSIRPHSTH